MARTQKNSGEVEGTTDGSLESPFMTLAEVAAYFRVTRQSVMRLSKTGTLPPPIRIGRAVRFRRDQIEAGHHRWEDV